MEKRINTRIQIHLTAFKNDIKNKINELNIDDPNSALLQFIYDYPGLIISSADLQKRKRAKNVVPFFNRCKALRSNHQQCSRRKKGESIFCGTHIKGAPNGTVSESKSNVEDESQNFQTIQVWNQDFDGIIYYIDDNGNVYDPVDIMQNNTNPKIINKYTKSADGNYSFVE